MKKSYTAARERAAWLDRSSLGRIVVSGVDRLSYLQGLLTNDVAALEPGTGCYATYLTAQGRMIADMHLYELGDLLLMTVVGDVKDLVLAKLDQFVFSEDVQLGDVTAAFAHVAVVGPQSSSIVAPLVGAPLEAVPEHGCARGTFAGAPAIVARASDFGVAQWDVFVGAEQREALLSALAAEQVDELSAPDAETLRIEAGVPRFHVDMNEETIPLEPGIENRAISFTKGCYVGQEVIIRVLHRGHGRVARRLVQLRIDGSEIPPRGAAIHAEGDEKAIGEVTSATFSPTLNQPIALGYVQRDFAEPDTSVRISSSSAGGNGSSFSSARVTQRIS
ncbi:MAG TPA: glycine cleavage T C-terminal barrel domain-containing protein [Vicinamibacterales bacterium]|nr:glycine cleavage T C-terminal barrel domain-containing protein [Vicinamibacterales bacterium]